jgi:hypothetical protein
MEWTKWGWGKVDLMWWGVQLSGTKGDDDARIENPNCQSSVLVNAWWGRGHFWMEETY